MVLSLSFSFELVRQGERMAMRLGSDCGKILMPERKMVRMMERTRSFSSPSSARKLSKRPVCKIK